MNINQLNSKVNHHILILLFLILSTIIILNIITHKQSAELSNIECAIGLKECDSIPALLSQPNPLEGWATECSNWTIVEEYELVGEFEDTYSLCRADRNCMNEFNEWWDNVGTSSKNELYDVFKVCMYDCENLHRNDTFPSKPYIRYWNETVCIKETLVREVK